MEKQSLYWYGVEVSAKNFRMCNVTGLKVVDLTPVNGKWPDQFWASKNRVPYSLIRSEPLPKKSLYLSCYNV